MKGPWPVKSIPALTGGIAIAVLVVWLSRGPALTMTTRLPGADGVPAGLRPATAPAAVDLATLVTLSAEAFKAERSAGPGKPAELPGSWPAFRGPSRDGISREDTPLAESWPPGGPPVLWRVDTGQGHAGPAVHAGRIYLLDYDEKNQRDAVRANGELACLDTSGTIKWTSGKGDLYGKGKGPLLLAGGRLYVMDEKATLTLVAASPDGYKRLARANVIEKGHYSWAPMAIARGRLILRDITRMVCLDVRARP